MEEILVRERRYIVSMRGEENNWLPKSSFGIVFS